MKKLIIALTMMVTLASCKKKEIDSLARTIVGTWRLTAMFTLSGKDNSILATRNYTDCEKATDYIFDPDGTYTITYVQKVSDNCDQTPFSVKGTYNYNPVTKKLNTTLDTHKTEINVLMISQFEMRYGIPTEDENGDGIKDILAIVHNR